MSTETETPVKKSILTRAMENVRAQENGEVAEDTTVQKKMIKKIAFGAGAVVAGTVALTVVLKTISSRTEDAAPEEETDTQD